MQIETKYLNLLPKALQIEITENIYRKDYTMEEKVEISSKIEEKLKEIAKEHMSLGSKGGSADPPLKRASDKAAKLGGFGSRRTYERAKKVMESNDQELIKEMNETEKVDRVK